jgi:hypothetical protein
MMSSLSLLDRRQKEESGKGWLRSWVQLPPSPFLSVVQLLYWFEFIFGYCRTIQQQGDETHLETYNDNKNVRSVARLFTYAWHNICLLSLYVHTMNFVFVFFQFLIGRKGWLIWTIKVFENPT